MPKFLSMVTDADKIDTTSSINKFTTSGDISKLAGIAAGAQVNQNAFSNVAVSGQTTVVADATTDTLTLVAGENITITTDAATDSITIASSGSTAGAMVVYTEEFTATEGQTLFTLTSGSYTQLNDRLTIYIWGLRQHNTAFSETSTTSFTLAAGVPLGTKVLAEWRVTDPVLKGDIGTAATVAVGTTTTGNAGTNASVVNAGTSSAALLNFTIPKGDQGIPGGNITTAAELPIVDAGTYFAATNVETALQEIGLALGSLSAAAADISIVDAGTYFIGTNVEVALQEVGANKAPLASPTFTGTVVLPSTTSIGNVNSTELEYLDGVTSPIQTQLGTKAPLASPTFTGTVTVATRIDFGTAASIIYNSTTKSFDFIINE